MNKISIKDELTEFLLYTSPKGDVKVEVILNKETVWLTQKPFASIVGHGKAQTRIKKVQITKNQHPFNAKEKPKPIPNVKTKP